MKGARVRAHRDKEWQESREGVKSSKTGSSKWRDDEMMVKRAAGSARALTGMLVARGPRKSFAFPSPDGTPAIPYGEGGSGQPTSEVLGDGDAHK